jgi:transcriptional regulator with XRE-family HTH domain
MEKSISSRDYGIFLECLREARRKAELTQAELAEAIGETQSFVSKCERGERRIDIAELRVFCNVFEISLASFVKNFEKRL